MTFATAEHAAESAIESLRYGTPPPGSVLEFTVGRQPELDNIRSTLVRHRTGGSPSHLVKANYGSGKSHLLRVIEEMALAEHYVVSLITAEAQAGVRFNRMEMVVSAACRHVALPDRSGDDIGALFDRFTECIRTGEGNADLIRRIRGNWMWYGQTESPGLWIALRAWAHDVGGYAKTAVRNWLSFTFEHGTAHPELYLKLVKAREHIFNDPRTSTEMKRDHVFDFRHDGHRQSWAALNDLDLIARACGYRGFVLLVDEFEDVIHNLNNVRLEKLALNNLLRFFGNFAGLAYFAVTPDFLAKAGWHWMHGAERREFSDLPSLTLSPVTSADALTLLRRIRSIHAVAYDWNPSAKCDDRSLIDTIRECERSGDPAWLRRAITDTIRDLDSMLEP